MRHKILACAVATSLSLSSFAFAQTSDSMNDGPTTTTHQSAQTAKTSAPAYPRQTTIIGSQDVRSNAGKTLPAHPPAAPANKTD